MIQFIAIKEVEFTIYIHDKGEEYFLHYDYWPAIPISYHVKSEDESIDIEAQKEIKHTDEKCEKREDYSYFGIPSRGSKLDKYFLIIKV